MILLSVSYETVNSHDLLTLTRLIHEQRISWCSTFRAIVDDIIEKDVAASVNFVGVLGPVPLGFRRNHVCRGFRWVKHASLLANTGVIRRTSTVCRVEDEEIVICDSRSQADDLQTCQHLWQTGELGKMYSGSLKGALLMT